MSQPKTSQADYGPHMLRTLLVALALALGLASTAVASTPRHFYVPKPHKSCRAHYVRRVVRTPLRHGGHIVRRHGRTVWVRQARCYYVAPKVTAPAPKTTPAPTATAPVHYSTSVDPTFVQSPTSPLAVTYTYDASAFAGTVNLGAAGQLPAGVLNFYSPTTPGGPVGLVCSMNVGAAITGGQCSVTYSQVGTYEVTTQYIPNAATAATETDAETIDPFSTTTSISRGPNTGDYVASVVDQNGNSVQVSPYDTTWIVTDVTTGQVVGNFASVGLSANFYQALTGSQNVGYHPSICVDSTIGRECSNWINTSDSFVGQVVYGPPSGSSWTGSSSTAIPLTPAP